MKSNKISFLFLHLFWAIMVSFHTQNMSGQKVVDSTDYYYNLAINPNGNDDLVLAYNYFIAHKKTCLDNKYKEGAIRDLSVLTIIQKESGFYHDSEASAIEALSLLDELEVSDYSIASKISLYNELGKICRALKEHDRALIYYNKAFEIATQPEQRTIILNNRALNYLDTKEYQAALSEFQKAYDISVTIVAKKEMARNLDNVGYVKAKLGHPDALLNMQRALSQRLELNDTEGAYASHMHLFEYYREMKEEQTARSHLNEALSIANSLNNNSYMLDALSEYMNLNTDSLVTTYKALNDKINLKNLVTENKYASRKYDYTKKELEAERNKIQKQRYQMLGGLLVVLAICSYFLLRFKHKKDKIQQVFNTETRISKKIHDELANDMSGIMNYVETDLETSEESKTKLLTTLQDVYVRTRDISTETASIDFVNFSDSLKYLLLQHNKPNVKIIVNDINTIEWSHHVSDHKKLAVYRCLQELMVNMKKHSHAKIVSVAFKKIKNKHEIRYVDDGQGFDIEKINQTGLRNAENRIKEVGGIFKFETSIGKGVKATITF